jgi:hypothetical protein
VRGLGLAANFLRGCNTPLRWHSVPQAMHLGASTQPRSQAVAFSHGGDGGRKLPAKSI